ncbi:helix-turn-helix domain-containing protein [Propionivibrio dicarboxylicus]|nr:AraC family transcriptional regulator [Propionivibrio dicarboxylicus]
MIEQPFKKISVSWLEEFGNEQQMDVPEEDDFLLSQLPLPSKIGTGRYERINLAFGMSFSRFVAKYSREAVGKIYPLTTVDAQFKETSFQVCIPRNLRLQFEEQYPPEYLAPSQGVDLYRYTDRYQTKISADCTHSGDATVVTIAYSVLCNLIGTDSAYQLLGKLGVGDNPSVVVRPTPLYVSNHVLGVLDVALTGPSRRLFVQARSLEYLAALVDYVCGDEPSKSIHDNRSKQRVQALREDLIGYAGKLPTLDELAIKHGRSAKILNGEFQKEYGQSIHAFIVDHRLQQAHEAIRHTDISIKSVSAALGYSHTSNFAIAFKRKFGYPPGSLRKQQAR